MKKENTSRAGNYKDGQWQVVRLRFLVDFLKASGLATGQVAELMGITRQSVYHWLAKDDMKLSTVYSLFERAGYRIDFSYESEDRVDDANVVVSMQVLPPVGGARLFFLKRLLQEMNISNEELAVRLGVGRATVYHWFKADDCMVSSLHSIAATTGRRLQITIRYAS